MAGDMTDYLGNSAEIGHCHHGQSEVAVALADGAKTTLPPIYSMAAKTCSTAARPLAI